MSFQKKVAAIHDISGYGRCSLSVILPVLSVMGIQACPIPTAVLSTHTGGFSNIVMQDLTSHIEPCLNHYKREKIEFDCIYSGFLASKEQINICLEFFENYNSSLKVVDPVMGDNGKPYKTITTDLANGMKELVSKADVITPNITEAAMLLGESFPSDITASKAKSWLARLSEKVRIVVITSVPMADGKIVNIGYDREQSNFWRVDCDFVPVHYPGTGDIFASVLVGGLLKGDSLPIAIDRATTFTQIAVKTTYGYGAEARGGVMFETVLGWLTGNVTLDKYYRL